jgi:hypothetical protein
MRKLPSPPTMHEASSSVYWDNLQADYGITPSILHRHGAKLTALGRIDIGNPDRKSFDLTCWDNVSAAIHALLDYCLAIDPNYPNNVST